MKVLSMKNFFYKYKDLLFFLGLIAIYLVWSFDNFFYPGEDGIEFSWRLGLNWSRSIGAQYGKDFIFTYGPLYYFAGHAIPAFYSSKAFLLINLGINLFFAAIKASVVFFFYRRANSSNKMYAAIFAGVVMLLCVHEHLWVHYLWVHYLYLELVMMFATMLLCDSFYELCENNAATSIKHIINNILASLLMVIAQYVKFSFFNIVIVLIISFSVLYIFHRKNKIAAIFVGSYIVLSILIWIISGQSIKNIFSYIYTGLQLSSGFTPAMSRNFTDVTVFNFFVFAFITIGAFVVMLIYFAIKKKLFYFISMLFISPQIFLLFKQSFVRADMHAYAFMGTIPFIALYLLFVSVLLPSSSPPSTQKSQLFVNDSNKCILIISIIVTWVSMSVTNNGFLPKNNAYQIIKDYRNYENNINETKQHIRNYYGNYYELAYYINTDETTDIFPWDISLLYAYDLNWQPRPVIQSYTNYTQALDKLTAGHFLTEKAPDKLIYTPMTIGERYALFDEPETFRTVLLNYSSVACNNTYLILEKNKQINSLKMDEICTVTAKKGEIIDVPFCEDAYVFMEVDWDFNFLGKLANFFFKTTYANIELYLTNGRKLGYRFVHKPALNGLFVSKYVSNTNELMQVFNKDFIPDITGIRISGTKLFYKKNINVKFYKIKVNKIPIVDTPIVPIVPIANIPIPQDITSIWVNDISSISKQDDNIIMYCGTHDAFISLPLQEPIDKPSHPVLEIKYSNSTAGNIQIFYDFGNGYSEIDSFRTKLEISSERSTLRVPIIWKVGKKLVSVRIDPPDGTKFVLESIWLYGN